MSQRGFRHEQRCIRVRPWPHRSQLRGTGPDQTLGARLISVAPGRVVIAAPIRPEVSQQHGFAHAGLAFALGDSAAGYAALSLMPQGAEVLTIEMKINLIAPASGERLIATGEVVKSGRRITVVRAEVAAETDGTARVVAVLQGTMIVA